MSSTEKKLVLLGGGGHCLSVLDAALRSGEFSEIVVTDPNMEVGSRVLSSKVVGTDEILPELFEKGFKYAFVTVGSIKTTKIRRKIYENAKAIGFEFPDIIDPSAAVSEFAEISEGVFIGKNASVNACAKIGKNAIINTGTIIEHSDEVGDFTHIAVGATLGGDTKVGDDSFVGAGSVLINDISVGNHVIISAGSAVFTDVPDDSICFGQVRKKEWKELS